MSPQHVRITRHQSNFLTVALPALMVIAVVTDAWAQPAQQHLVRAGQDWTRIAQRAGPGHEIILMPGRHLAGSLSGIEGTQERPIIIRGVDPQQPVELEVDLYGLRLRDCRHLRFENLRISGARIAGILIESETPFPSEIESRSANIVLVNVHIHETGPSGQRHAIHLRGVDEVRIESCVIRGWAGSGIEAVAVRGLHVLNSLLEGAECCSQLNGIRLRAGTRDVRIESTVLRAAGEQAISLGGASRDAEFRTIPATSEPVYEAKNVVIRDCLIEGARCALAFVHVRDVTVQRTTIHRPGRFLFSVRLDREDARHTDSAEIRLEENILSWRRDELEALMQVGPGASTDGLERLQNLWWSAGEGEGPASDEAHALPGEEIFPQTTDVDPLPDAEGRATEPAAKTFGRLQSTE